MSVSHKNIAARCEFRARLLQPTLENAARTTFYRQAWLGSDYRAITLETLAELPLVRKADLLKAGPEAQLTGDQVCDEVLSSGSTGQPFITVRGKREQQCIAEFFGELNCGGSSQLMARALRIDNPQHGTLVRVPAGVRLHPVSIYDWHCFTYALRVLSTSFDEPGVEPHCVLILAAERCLRAFLQYLIATGNRPDLDQPRCAMTFSHYVSADLRKRARETLNATIVDRFSLSEVFGGATEDPEDGWYSFDPLIIPEVVALDHAQPITEGIGELVVTALYPFQEAQPIVRFATGDLVAVSQNTRMFPGEPHIKPLGRVAYSVVSERRNEVLLSAVDLYEAIDCLPWPSRKAVFRDAYQVVDPHGLGDARYKVEHRTDNEKDYIHVRIRARETADDDTNDEQARQVYNRLLNQSTILRDRIATDAAELKISIVDQLDSYWLV